MGWVGFDLDGVLAYQYDQFKGPQVIGPPIPQMIKRLKDHINKGHDCRILTARAYYGDQSIGYVKKWLKDNGLPDLPITNEKDGQMKILYDDRRVNVQENTGKIYDRNQEKHTMQLNQAVKSILKQLMLQKKKQAPKGTNIRKVLRAAKEAGREGASWTQLHNAILGKSADSDRSSKNRGKNISRINRRAGKDNGRDDQGQIDDSKYKNSPLIKKNKQGDYVITQRGVKKLIQLDKQLGNKKQKKNDQ